MNHTSGFKKIVEAIKPKITETDIATIKQRLDNNHTFLLIDVRETEEWQQGHIPTAIHLSKGIIERDINQIVPDETTEIILYCGGGSRSALAAYNLQLMGYTNVKSMDGGFRGWVLSGFDIIK